LRRRGNEANAGRESLKDLVNERGEEVNRRLPSGENKEALFAKEVKDIETLLLAIARSAGQGQRLDEVVFSGSVALSADFGIDSFRF